MKWKYSVRYKNDLGEDYEHEVCRTLKDAEEVATKLSTEGHTNIQIVDLEKDSEKDNSYY